MNINDNIKLLQGDCFETIKTISDKSIDLVLTDPPYEHIKGGMKSKFNTGIMSKDSVINTKLNDFSKDKVINILELLKSKFRDSYNGYFFCSKLQVPYYLEFAENNKLN